MFTSLMHVSKWTGVVAIALFGLFLGTVWEARAAESARSQNGSMIKNLMAPTYHAPWAQAAAPLGLTKKEVKRLTATAETREDHLKLAVYYKAEADRLDAQAAEYEEAAAAYRRNPIVKNLMAPSTAGRYEVFAKRFRDEAKSDRVLAASHDEMANEAVAMLGEIAWPGGAHQLCPSKLGTFGWWHGQPPSAPPGRSA